MYMLLFFLFLISSGIRRKETLFAKLHVYMYIEVKHAVLSGCIPLILEKKAIKFLSFSPIAFSIECVEEKIMYMLLFIKEKINPLNMDMNS